MNTGELRAEIARNKLSIPKLASLIGIGKKAMYAKIKGESQFKQEEIRSIKNVLGLTDEKTAIIFFA